MDINDLKNMDAKEAVSVQTEGKKSKKTGKYILWTFFYVTLAFLVVILGTAVYAWVNRMMTDEVETVGKAVEGADGKNLTEVYTKEQMDELQRSLIQEMETEVAKAEQNGKNSVLNALKEGLEQSSTAIETVRRLFPEDLVVASDGRYFFVPIDRSLKMNDYRQENLEILETGEFRYLRDGEVVSHKGIDVSSHQGNIDWKKVFDDGVEFTIIRCAYRGYGSGALVEDTYCEKNVKGATEAGIHVGLYIFSQAVNEEEMKEEAEMIMNRAKELNVTGPLVLDVERVSDPSGRMNLISPEERTTLVKLYCDTVKAAGYTPMIYHNTNMGAIMIDVSKLEEYDKWFASYSEILYYPYQYKIWQYSSSGSVNGIKGNVDLNISFTRFWE